MYEKEIDLTKAIEYTCKTNFSEIYYFDDENDDYADGVIYHSLADNNEVKEEFNIDGDVDSVLDISKIVLERGKTVFCLLGQICDNSDFGEEGFSVESSTLTEDYDIDSSNTLLETGGFGVYINKEDDKYVASYGLYSLQPTFPHGPADKTFKHFSKEYESDIIGKDIISALDSMDVFIEESVIPEIDEVEKIIKNAKHKRVNIEETILQTVKSGWMEENYFVSLTDGTYIFDAMGMEDMEYDFLSDDYFRFIEEKLDDEGIYIALGYACPENGGCPNPKDGEEGTGVCTWRDGVDLCLPEDAVLGDMETDYGIQVFKRNGQYEVTFSFNDSVRYGHAMGYREISSIEDKLDEQLHRILVKMMNDAIIFEE